MHNHRGPSPIRNFQWGFTHTSSCFSFFGDLPKALKDTELAVQFFQSAFRMIWRQFVCESTKPEVQVGQKILQILRYFWRTNDSMRMGSECHRLIAHWTSHSSQRDRGNRKKQINIKTWIKAHTWRYADEAGNIISQKRSNDQKKVILPLDGQLSHEKCFKFSDGIHLFWRGPKKLWLCLLRSS